MAVWVVLVVPLGGIPREHRAPLWMMFGPAPAGAGDFERAPPVSRAEPAERAALRRAVVRCRREGGQGARQRPIGEPRAEAEAISCDLLRRVAGGRGDVASSRLREPRAAGDSDGRRFLSRGGTIAERDPIGKRLIDDGADAFDLHTLETVARRASRRCRAPPAVRLGGAAPSWPRPSSRSRRALSRSASGSSESPLRRITIRSGSIVTSTGRWPAQCSE